MNTLTVDRLRAIMRECAGQDESVDLDGEIGDTSFMDLGYDSVALLETTSRLEREFDVTLDDDSVNEAATPNALISLVNESLSAHLA